MVAGAQGDGVAAERHQQALAGERVGAGTGDPYRDRVSVEREEIATACARQGCRRRGNPQAGDVDLGQSHRHRDQLLADRVPGGDRPDVVDHKADVAAPDGGKGEGDRPAGTWLSDPGTRHVGDRRDGQCVHPLTVHDQPECPRHGMAPVGHHRQGQRRETHRLRGVDLDPGVGLHPEAGTPQRRRVTVERAGAAGSQITGQPPGRFGGHRVRGPAGGGTQDQVVGIGGRAGGAGEREGTRGGQGEHPRHGRLGVGSERFARVRPVAGDLQHEPVLHRCRARRGQQVGRHPQELVCVRGRAVRSDDVDFGKPDAGQIRVLRADPGVGLLDGDVQVGEPTGREGDQLAGFGPGRGGEVHTHRCAAVEPERRLGDPPVGGAA